ncbi:small acid-soluble spore protein P [Paenibacillus sp. sgz500958]
MKPKSMPAPGSKSPAGNQRREHKHPGPEPLSGSKKVKQANHVDHHNPEG